jgi:hypothetical protein
MTTEHDLDTRLLAARGVRDAELPALPAAFLDFVHTSDVRQQDAVPASVLAAEQLVQDARDRRAAVGRRTRRPGRRSVLGVGIAVLTAAAAWTTAVLVTGPETAAPQSEAPPSQASPVDELGLVAFELPAYPLTLPTAPEGASGPVFGGAGDGTATMSYADPENRGDSMNISVGTEPVPGPLIGPGEGVVEEQVTIGGRPGRLTVLTFEGDGGATAYLDWERLPGQWVIINAQGRYADREVLTTIAEELIDGPQAMAVQLHLAPAGYSLDFFKDDGRVVSLRNDADPTQGLIVRLQFPDEVQPADRLPGTVMETRTVQGRPADLIRTDMGSGGREGWYLQARLPDGTTFVVEAPGTLTQEQVLQIADQVTYTP